MLLEHKRVVIYGACGAIGGAVARAFAREGARLFLAGRTLATLDVVARDISVVGGAAKTTQARRARRAVRRAVHSRRGQEGGGHRRLLQRHWDGRCAGHSTHRDDA